MGSDSTQVQDVIVGVELVTVEPPAAPEAPPAPPPVDPPAPIHEAQDATIEQTGADPPPAGAKGSSCLARRPDARGV